MSVHGIVIDRLRANLRAARIPFTEADIEGIVQKRLLEGVLAFEERRTAWSGGEPDYLRPPQHTPLRPRPDSPGSREPGAPPTADRFETLTEAAARIRAGAVSPVALAEQALARVALREPVLNALQAVLAESALEAARRAEHEIAAGKYRGPLHGVPVAVKDLLALAGTATTAGSKILAGEVSSHDAAAVERLKAAGAVILGKTRLSEFAYSPGSINAHFGATRNPWDEERDTGGSSSGSAAAVADGMVYAAIGSDTGGSIRIPAALCGIVGLKPTFGRVSLHGVAPLSWSLDHLGPMTRSVADAAAVLEVLAGHDPRDPRSRASSRPAVPHDLEQGVRGLRVGVPGARPEAVPLAGEEAWAAARAGLAALEGEGAEVVPVDLPEMEDLWLVNYAILAVEAASLHEPWLRSRLADYGELPRQRLLASYAHGPAALADAQRQRAVLRERMHRLFRDIDLLAMPAQPEGAPPLGSPGWTRPTAPFNVLGWPALTLPVGWTRDGMPLGLQLAAREWEEATVLRAGRAVEASLGIAKRAPDRSA